MTGWYLTNPENAFKQLYNGKISRRQGGSGLSSSCGAKAKGGGKLPVTVQFLFSQFEEIGGMGAQTGSFALCPDEALAVDVGFGDNVGVDADKCQKLGKGPQIGFLRYFLPK